MYDFERLEKFIRWIVILVFVAVVLAWIGQEIVAVYFTNNPTILSSWIGELIEGFHQ